MFSTKMAMRKEGEGEREYGINYWKRWTVEKSTYTWVKEHNQNHKGWRKIWNLQTNFHNFKRQQTWAKEILYSHKNKMQTVLDIASDRMQGCKPRIDDKQLTWSSEDKASHSSSSNIFINICIISPKKKIIQRKP